MVSLDSGSRSTAGPVPQIKGDGHDACEECGDMFDELAPPFCANCGAKTRYFGKTSAVSDAAEEEDDMDELPTPRNDDDDFGQDMLDELLDELRSDTARSTPAGSARTTKEATSGRNRKQSGVASRDTFAMKGDERFSERERETSRESKAVKKAKAVAVGAKPAIGGDGGWEALQAQMKKKQAEKNTPAPAAAVKKPAARDTFADKGDERFSERAQASAAKPKAQPATTSSRDTFAAKGDERFSERAQDRNKAKPPASGKAGDASWDALQAKMKGKQVAQKPSMRASEQERVADELDAELAALDAETKQHSKKKAAPAAPQPMAIPDGLSEEEYNACLQLQELLENDLLDVAEYNSRVAHIAKTRQSQKRTTAAASSRSTSQPASKSTPSKPMDIPDGLDDDDYEACQKLRELFDNDLLDAAEYNARVLHIAQSRQSRQQQQQSQQGRRTTVAPSHDEEFDAELAALEMDLGDSLAGAGGRVVQSTRGAPVAAAKHAPKKPALVTEKAKGGPALPEGLSWQQTPIKTEMQRGTFAHRGDDRFSDREDPNLPKGTLSESPAQACGFCHKGIVAGQKFKTGLGAVWHNDCFKCGVCLKKLEKGMKFFKGDLGSAICEDCKLKRRHVCFLCKQPTAKTEIVNVMGAKIHTGCFRCNICDASLLPGYVQSKRQFLCITHQNCEPVERHWGQPGDKGPGQAPAKAPVQYGPTEADKQRAANKRAIERGTRADVKEVEKGLDMLTVLMEEGGGLSDEQRRRNQEEEDDYFRTTESEILRDSEPRQSHLQVRRSEQPRQSEQSRYSEASRLSEVRKPSRNSGRASTQRQQDDDEYADTVRMSSAGMMDEADKPDWMKEREAKERGSFRTNAKKVQADLNRRQGVSDDAGYYNMSSSDEEDKPAVKVTYSSKAPQRKK